MSERRSSGLTALLILLASPVAAVAVPPTGPALEAIDACLERLHPDIDIGYERLVSRCPQLARRLEDTGWSPWLPRDWKRPGNDLSAGGLRELRELLSMSSRVQRSETRRPDVAGLPAALADLARANSVRKGWWSRAKEWLREVFERRAQASDDDWLSRLISQNGLPQTVIELTAYVTLMLVFVLAGVIVLNEVRISGVAAGWRGKPRPARLARSPVETKGGALTWEAMNTVPPVQRPRVLLELIVAELICEGRLPHVRGLTVGEVVRAARLTNENDRAALTELARVSERVRFAGAPVPEEELTAALECGRALFERLSSGAQGPLAHGRRV